MTTGRPLTSISGGISQQMLTRTLRALEADGIICRTVFATVPPQVEYSLTPLGMSLSAPLMQLAYWVVDHLGELEENRERFEAVEPTRPPSTLQRIPGKAA